MLIDTHCHLDDERYAEDQESMLERAVLAGVKQFVTIGCDITTSQRALAVTQTVPQAVASVGVHPHEAQKAPSDFITQLTVLAAHPKCVAIGECGLDYYYTHSPRDIQQEVFRAQIRLALDVKKPLIVHVRDAHDDCLRILKEEQAHQQPIIIHCFTGSLEHAKQFLNDGCYLSISGVITFKKPGDLPEVVKMMPLDKLLIETDAPYLAPIPHRGKRNEPAFITEVCQTIASLLNMPYEQVATLTTQNAKRVFNI